MTKPLRPPTRVDDTGAEFHSKFSHLEYQFGQLFSTRPLISPHARYVFETKEKLGEGGMGTVYRVRDHRLGREAALKMINKGLDDENVTRRFLREAEVTARLVHPAIPPVHEAGLTVEGQLYMLMRVIEGKTLTEAIARSAQLVEDRRALIEVLIRVGEAVAYAHTQGIVHRDLKPDNIMIGDFGEVMLMDWGVAKDLNAEQASSFEKILDTNRLDAAALHSAGLTLAGAIVGTPGYMSPEQLESEEIDGRADVFSLGLILTEILTGEAAISGENTLEVIATTLSGHRSTPQDIDRSIPGELNWIAIQATQLKREQRTKSARDLVDQLKCYLAGDPVPGYPYSSAEKLQRWIKGHPVFLLTLTMTMVFSTVAALLWIQLDKEKQRVLAAEARRELEQAQSERDALLLEKEVRASRAKTRQAEEKKEEAEIEAANAKKVLLLINEARSMVQRGSPLASVRETLNEALKIGGRSVELLLNSAQIMESLGELDEASLLLEEVTRKSSPAYQALFQLHHIELKRRGVDFVTTKALLRILKLATERGDENEFTLFAEANRVASRGQYKEAIELLNRVEKYTLNSSWTYAQRGLYLSNIGKTKEGLKDLNKALKIDPKLSIAYYNRAMAYGRLKDYKKSLSDYNNAIKYRRRFAQAFVNRGNLLRQLGRKKEALEDFSYGIQANPKLPQAFFNRGTLYDEFGDLKRAADDIDRAIQLNPKYSKAYHFRGHMKKEKNDLKGAMADFSMAIQSNPRNAEPLYSRSLIYAEWGQRDKAIEDCQAAIKANSSYVAPYVHIGQILFARGQTEDAIKQLTKSIQLFPKYSNAYFSRALCWSKKKQYKKAFDDYSKAIQYNRKFARAFVNRGILLKKNGQRKDALLDFTQAMKLNPALEQAYFNRAQLFEEMREFEKALSDWKSLKRRARRSDYRKHCDAQIKRLTEKVRSP